MDLLPTKSPVESSVRTLHVCGILLLLLVLLFTAWHWANLCSSWTCSYYISSVLFPFCHCIYFSPVDRQFYHYFTMHLRQPFHRGTTVVIHLR